MAQPSTHRPTQSISSNNLQAPTSVSTQMNKQQRRMTSPALSQSSLNLPDGAIQQQHSLRPPSPLRNGFIPDTSTGIDPTKDSEAGSDDEDNDRWHERSPSPSSSVSQLAASFAQRVGSFVGNMTPRSPNAMPTDAELEAEAERERDKSRREAEAILTREAQERKLVEERVLAMMESTRSLPPPPSRSQTMPDPPSPSNSQKESTSWWAAAKNRLTPTKESLTPAQQIIQDTKAREKEEKKQAKGKGKEKEKEWPANPQGKYNDPAMLNLNIPPSAPPQRRPAPASPSSPTPARPAASNMAPNLTPSPMRSIDAMSSSPSRETPPLYAQFNAQGTLDIPGTLLTIAKRFEKLEKWTVGHVRALEERMSDVERWLVDKEKEKEEEKERQSLREPQKQNSGSSSDVQSEIKEMKEEMTELQGRVGELGREMARIATSSSNLSAGPKSSTVSVTPQTISAISMQGSSSPPSSVFSTPLQPRLSSTARESTSPPMAAVSRTPTGTRLPYPTGDYASPPDAFSPTNSPPGSLTSATRSQPILISGLPYTNSNAGLGISSSASTSYSSASFSSTSSISSGIGGRPMSPPGVAAAAAGNSANANATSNPRRAASPPQGLPPPKSLAQLRQTSTSPTPRKRYTVALGAPITSPPTPTEPNMNMSMSQEQSNRVGTPVSFHKAHSSISTALFTSSPPASTTGLENGSAPDNDQDEKGFQDETIGKSASRIGKGILQPSNSSNGVRVDEKVKQQQEQGSLNSSANRRLKAQSAYGLSSIQNMSTAAQQGRGQVQNSGTPLSLKMRSRSTERLAGGRDDVEAAGPVPLSAGLLGSGKFVDPLALRRQESRESTKLAMPKPVGKVPIGQLVAFFDKEKGDKA